ncbi:hypothetical protein ABPG72_013986 [Tetrahymena utriculariae]
MDIEEKQITLQSEEGQQFKIDYQAMLQFSKFIQDQSDLSLNEPLKCAISTPILEMIIQFVNDRKTNYQPKEISTPLLSGNISLYINDIDYQFLKNIKSEKDLYQLLKAAEYFYMDVLLELIYAFTASQFIDKTNLELREKYGIYEPMTEAIEKELKDKYSDILQGTPFEE